MKFKVTIHQKHCKGCGLCISICPHHSLSMDNTYNQQGQPVAKFLPDATCIGCRQCALICPDAAIEITEIETKASNKKTRARRRRAADDDR